VKIKQLEIIGFKSFVDRAVLTFDKDITGVVGPNGCGKSNIVDAIRWVMGEQSAKHLRGKQMEDVIFAGSATRAPLSMASVELTFSTDGYQTPAAYLNHSEISICRRLYRTGESEYFINKTPVRLKDITELFLGTGIGTKAYSIIEQGKIGQIVTAKPEERRFYIEEVAGVTKFKARKEAALRKMEVTKQNLLRLNDVVEEIGRQMRSLERQAKKAERYRTLHNEFKKWDLAYSSNQYATGSQKQIELEGHLRLFGESESQLETRLAEEESQLEAKKLSVLETEKEMNRLQNGLFEVTNYVRITENTLAHKKEEEKRLSRQALELESDIREMEEEIKGLQTGLGQMSDQYLVAELENSEHSHQMELLEQSVGESQNNLVRLRTLLETGRQNIHEAKSRLTQIETIKAELQRRGEELRTNIQTLAKQKEAQQNALNELKAVYAEATSSLNLLKELKEELTTQTGDVAVELNSHRENSKGLRQNLDKLKEELTLKKSRLASLEELQKNFEGYQEGTRKVLLRKDELAQENVFGTVADFVETEPQYEGAVSAVLGEKLQYVVVKSQQEGIEAMDYLRTGSHGRTSFIPMKIRSHESTSGEIAHDQSGVLGPIANFVSLKDNYDHLSRFLFGDVVLVENLSQALNIWASNGHKKTLVTLNGEVVDPSGVVTGGTLANTSKALLEKKREMKELAVLVDTLYGETHEREQKLNQANSTVHQLETRLEGIKNSSVEEGIKIANQEKDIEHFKKEIESLDQKQQEIGRQIEKASQALESLEPELESLNNEQTSLENSLDENEKLDEQLKTELEASEKAHLQQTEKLTRLKIELAQTEQKKGHLESEINRLSQEILNLRHSLADRHSASLITADEGETLEQTMAHLTKVLDKRLGKKEELEKELTANKESYEKANQALRESEVSIKEIRKNYGEASKKVNDVALELTEIRSELKHLTEQCFERHQLSLADICDEYKDGDIDMGEAAMKVGELKEKLARLGGVNTDALQEFEELKERYEFLVKQKADLETSLSTLERVIHKINRTTRERFLSTFNLVNERFQSIFPTMFRGGKAHLQLTDEANLLETGVEIIAQPPGKKLQSISLLSGGEKALTAVSLVFAMFQIKPSPFCLLDEVDAPLDDANVERYNEILRSMTHKTQFIVITHNKKTMETVDVLYGVTMQEAGASQLVSVELN
jgi:chromosome segregation protein